MSEATVTIGYKPLYRQVSDILVQHLVEGRWAPGSAIPSEMQLAAELNVSQGTVRKALDEMTADGLVIRRQGRGTFVAEQDDRRILFRFFKLSPDKGDRQFPASALLNLTQASATKDERDILGLKPGAQVVRIWRSRSLNGIAAVSEYITLPVSLFPDLSGREIPNNLYSLFSMDYGITIKHADERLKAVAATAQDAEILDVAAGSPLLQIERIAYALNGAAVEWRRSLCRTDRFHYVADPS